MQMRPGGTRHIVPIEHLFTKKRRSLSPGPRGHSARWTSSDALVMIAHLLSRKSVAILLQEMVHTSSVARLSVTNILPPERDRSTMTAITMTIPEEADVLMVDGEARDMTREVRVAFHVLAPDHLCHSRRPTGPL